MTNCRWLLLLLAFVVALGVGCTSSGSGGTGDGTLTVSVTGVDLLSMDMILAQAAQAMIFGVFAAGSNWMEEDALAWGGDYIAGGAASALAYLDVGGLWRGQNGTTYYVIVAIDEDGDKQPSAGDWVVGSGGMPEPYTFVLQGDTVLSFDETDFDFFPGFPD